MEPIRCDVKDADFSWTLKDMIAGKKLKKKAKMKILMEAGMMNGDYYLR